ncbi:MAG: helix-turn-helix transcriptional regulator [Thermoanaerobaculia bacterium]|nr:helix-turn-helix transcriptional regulator [Thermoanaerobaculia bacterium]
MSRRDHLGEFEQIVILGLLQLGDGAHGAAVRREIEQRTGRSAKVGAVYATLERLERKGLVASRLGAPTPERGGRAKRCFTVLPAGRRALVASQRMVARMSEGLSLSTGEEP